MPMRSDAADSFAALPGPSVSSILFARDRKGFTHPSESYRHWVVLGLMSGSFRYGFGRGGGETLCEPGEFLVCPPQVLLRRKALSAVDFYFIKFQWKNSLAHEWQGKHSLIDLARMDSTLAHLEKLPSHPQRPADKAWANHLLLDLFQQRRQERSVERTKVLVPDKQMIQAAEKMKRDITGTFNMEEMAAAMRMTPSGFSRRFKAAFGSNPALYRTQIRMQESRRLLLETALSLEEIAEACGYENAFYFSRVFHAHNGRPPSRYRKSLRV